MKNAASYAKKVKKLLGRLPPARPGPEEDADPVRVLIRSVLEADASHAEADRALAALEEEFTDFNELRAAPPRDLLECVGRQLPRAREKSEVLVKVLNGIFQRAFDVSLEYMRDMTKRDLRRHLNELGLDAYAAARVVATVFGGHAIPVDRTLVECLEMDGYIHPGSDVADVQGFLERIILHKDALAAHQALREYVARSAKALARKRKAEQAAAKEAAEARASAAAEARRQRAKKARAAAKAKKAAKKAPKKAPAKPVRKKAAKGPARKEPGKKTSRKK